MHPAFHPLQGKSTSKYISMSFHGQIAWLPLNIVPQPGTVQERSARSFTCRLHPRSCVLQGWEKHKSGSLLYIQSDIPISDDEHDTHQCFRTIRRSSISSSAVHRSQHTPPPPPPPQVDLPGYGHGNAPVHVVDQWNILIGEYIRKRFLLRLAARTATYVATL